MLEQKRIIGARYPSGQGEVKRSQPREKVGELICAWVSYGGFRIGPCPKEAPPYSHI